MTPTEALATLFAALWLVTAGLFLIVRAGYDDAKKRLAQAEAAVATVEAERDSCLALANEYAPVPFELVDISEDVADLHAAAYFEDLGWQA